MDPVLASALVAVVAIGVALTLWGERRDDRRFSWAGKPAASLAFVTLGVLAQAPTPILVALALAAVGDVLLIPRDERVFRAGVVAFLLAHVAFTIAFIERGVDAGALAVGLALFAALAFLLARRILPGVSESLRRAVVPYMLVITVMVGFAVGTQQVWLVVPALLFYANDVTIAHHRFVRRDWRWRLTGLPLYYAAQVLFALSS